MATKKRTKKPKDTVANSRKRLSNVPSTLLMQAVEDLEKVEASPNYEVYMGTWVNPPIEVNPLWGNPLCEVCLGGAALVCAYGVKGGLEFYSDAAQRKAFALDCFRIGDYYGALRYYLGVEPDKAKELREQLRRVVEQPVSYSAETADEFKFQMRLIAAFLKASGY